MARGAALRRGFRGSLPAQLGFGSSKSRLGGHLDLFCGLQAPRALGLSDWLTVPSSSLQQGVGAGHLLQRGVGRAVAGRGVVCRELERCARETHLACLPGARAAP